MKKCSVCLRKDKYVTANGFGVLLCNSCFIAAFRAILARNPNLLVFCY